MATDAGCGSASGPASIQHGRSDARDVFISLQPAFSKLLESENLVRCCALQLRKVRPRHQVRCRRFAVLHRKKALDISQFEATALGAFRATLGARGHVFGGLSAKILDCGWIGAISCLLVRFQKAEDLAIVEEIVTCPDAFVADEDGRAGNENAHVMAALAAERAIVGRLCWF